MFENNTCETKVAYANMKSVLGPKRMFIQMNFPFKIHYQ